MQHLSLETCRKLQEVGFPQNRCEFSWWKVPDPKETFEEILKRRPSVGEISKTDWFNQDPTYSNGITEVRHQSNLKTGIWLCACSTIEEIIEQLGDHWWGLENNKALGARQYEASGFYDEDRNRDAYVNEAIPVQAMANLYLEIHRPVGEKDDKD